MKKVTLFLSFIGLFILAVSFNYSSAQMTIDSTICNNTGLVKLSRGMSGREVFELQDYLSNQGFLAAPIDGVYGRKTVEAVRLFQKNNGLKADGVFGAGSKNILCGTLVTSVPVATMGNTTPIQNSYIENNPQTSYNNTYSSQVPEGLQQLRASAAAAMEFSLNKMACSNARITLAQANPYLSYDSLYVDGVRCSY